MKKILYFAVLIVLLAGQSAYANDIKIGFVDLLRALNESDAGKKAKADLEFLVKSKQITIDEKGKALEKLRSELEKQSSVLSKKARNDKEDELEISIKEYQRLVSDSQNEIKKKESEFTDEIIKQLREVIQEIGKEEGYTIILEKAMGIVLYSEKEIDLTDTVIKRYNKSKAKAK